MKKKIIKDWKTFNETFSTDVDESNTKLKFKITDIDFDCSGDDMSPEEESDMEQKLAKKYIGKVIAVDDEEDLVDHISDESSWCVSNIKYDVIKK